VQLCLNGTGGGAAAIVGRRVRGALAYDDNDFLAASRREERDVDCQDVVIPIDLCVTAGGAAVRVSASLRSRYVNDERAVCSATDFKRPWPAADVAVPNELTFALRVDVHLEALKAVGANQLSGVVHGILG
jgi:hypothetical protein